MGELAGIRSSILDEHNYKKFQITPPFRIESRASTVSETFVLARPARGEIGGDAIPGLSRY